MPNKNSVIPPRKYQYESLWTGTVLWRKGAVSSAQSKRASSHLRVLASSSGLPFPADYKVLTAHMDPVALQRARRRARDIASVEVIHAVMAGAPNLVEVGAVLDRAAQMCAGGGKGAVLTFSDAQQEP